MPGDAAGPVAPPPGPPVGWSDAWQGAVPPKRRTNGLAIASLVLSILWLAGLGSILAIVFAVVSRRQIRASRGAETGEGMALAGLIVGIVGVIGLAGLVVVLVVLLTPRTVDLHYGERADFPALSVADAEGVASMTVESVAAPVAAPEISVPVVPGEQLAVATVELCANGNGIQNRALALQVDLLLPGGRTAVPYLDARLPALHDLSSLGPHQCGTGYLTYEIGAGQAVQGIRYHTVVPNRSYVWKP